MNNVKIQRDFSPDAKDNTLFLFGFLYIIVNFEAKCFN